MKYTPDGGILSLSISEKPSGKKELGCYEFIFEDNGIGMSQEFLKKIFEPFERVNNHAIDKIEGTGLGMSIVKNLLDRMGGEITVESEEGKGSRFHVSLPFVTAPPSKDALTLPAGQTVLIAENMDARAQQIADF